MNFEYFIANRIVKSKTAAKKITRPVVKISVGAIALGLIIMIIALATGNGLRQEIRGKVTGFAGDIQVLNYQPNPTYEQTPSSLSDSLLQRLNSLEYVNRVEPFGRKAGIIIHKDLFEGIVLKGVGGSYDWEVLRQYIREGNVPDYNIEGYNDSVLISKSLSQKLDLKLNNRFNMYFVRSDGRPPLLRKFYVSGIFQTDFEEIDENFIIGHLKHIQRLSKWDSNQVSGYEIYTDQKKPDRLAQQEIRGMLPFDLDAVTARQLNEQLFQWLDLFDLNIIVIIGIMIIVATINMSIALLILILERTQLIGILKALGSHNGNVRRIFMINAALLIGRGLFWGNLIGIGLCLLQKHFKLVKLDPSVYYVSAVSIDLNFMHILLLNIGTMLICLACLVLPSLIISRISPVKAIRFD